MSTDRTLSARPYYVVFAILLACTYLTWQVAYFDLGPFNTIAALTIAAFKAVLVVLVFMHARRSTQLTWAVIIGAIFWLVLLFALTMSDYLTRGSM